MTQADFIKTYEIPGTVEALALGNVNDTQAFASYQAATPFPAKSLTACALRILQATNFTRRTDVY